MEIKPEPLENHVNNVENHWLVSNREEFQFYLCPDCEFRSKIFDQFYDHAIENHQLAKETFVKHGVPISLSNTLKIKEEEYKTENGEILPELCVRCDQSFETAEELIKHFRHKHSNNVKHVEQDFKPFNVNHVEGRVGTSI